MPGTSTLMTSPLELWLDNSPLEGPGHQVRGREGMASGEWGGGGGGGWHQVSGGGGHGIR